MKKKSEEISAKPATEDTPPDIDESKVPTVDGNAAATPTIPAGRLVRRRSFRNVR